MSSSIIDYFTGGISDTYTQTVDYWSKDNSIADAVSVVSWSVQNPTIVKDATLKGVDNSLNELGTAVNQDTNKIIILAVLAAAAYIYLTKGGKK